MRIVQERLVERMRTFGESILPMHPHMQYALHALSKAAHMRSVAEVSRNIGWSRRWLSHAFAEQVGMTPNDIAVWFAFNRWWGRSHQSSVWTGPE